MFVTYLLILTFSISLLILSIIDLKAFLLPDYLTLPLLFLGLAVNSFNLFTDLKSAAWGAIGGYFILFSLNFFYCICRKKEGIGGGDFKLLAALGAWLGWQTLPVILLISSLSALGFLSIRALLKKGSLNQPIAFGPFLAAAGWLVLVLS